MEDKFGESGSAKELLEKSGLNEVGIYKKVKNVVREKFLKKHIKIGVS